MPHQKRTANMFHGATQVAALFLAALSGAGLSHPGTALALTFQTQDYKVTVETVASGLEHPWGMAKLPDGAFLVTERDGRLLHIQADRRTQVSGLPEIAAIGQGGLLDIEADEDFATSRRVFFTWSEPGDGGVSTALGSATLAPGNDRLENFTRLFAMARKTNAGFHFGSRVVLAPDGKLFMTMGDRGAPDRAQDMQDHAGGIVRLNRDGSIPADNPWVGGGALPELWSKGHRNPQGAAWDAERGMLWTVEHGARGGDEINAPQPGRNYGWPVISYGRNYSGTKIGIGQEAEGYEQPLWYWDPSIAPSGLTVYRGDLFPAWRGNLLAGALRGQLLTRLTVEDGKVTGEEQMLQDKVGRIRDVQVFDDGAIYLLTDEGDGALLRLVPAN